MPPRVRGRSRFGRVRRSRHRRHHRRPLRRYDRHRQSQPPRPYSSHRGPRTSRPHRCGRLCNPHPSRNPRAAQTRRRRHRHRRPGERRPPTWLCRWFPQSKIVPYQAPKQVDTQPGGKPSPSGCREASVPCRCGWHCRKQSGPARTGRRRRSRALAELWPVPTRAEDSATTTAPHPAAARGRHVVHANSPGPMAWCNFWSVSGPKSADSAVAEAHVDYARDSVCYARVPDFASLQMRSS